MCTHIQDKRHWSNQTTYNRMGSLIWNIKILRFSLGSKPLLLRRKHRQSGPRINLSQIDARKYELIPFWYLFHLGGREYISLTRSASAQTFTTQHFLVAGWWHLWFQATNLQKKRSLFSNFTLNGQQKRDIKQAPLPHPALRQAKVLFLQVCLASDTSAGWLVPLLVSGWWHLWYLAGDTSGIWLVTPLTN